MKIKFLDIVVLLIAVCILVLFSLAAYRNPNGKAVVHIKTLYGEWYYPLDMTGELSISGRTGATLISIKAGKVNVVASPCKEKICIKQGTISSSGEWIACLPNSVLITIEDKNNEEWDSISF